jgi:hypothetical protein
VVKVPVLTDRSCSEVVRRKLCHTYDDAINWCASEGVAIEPPFGPDQPVGSFQPFTPSSR